MLVVTTTQALWVVDEVSGETWQVDTGKGVYYGITWSETEVFVGARFASYGSAQEPQDNAILIFDHNFRWKESIRSPNRIRDVHQLFYYDGTLYVCSSFDDTILMLNGSNWTSWTPFPVLPGNGLDQHHINSIYIDRTGIALAGTKPQGYYAVFDHSRKPVTPKVALGDLTHNVWRRDGMFYVASSGSGVILDEAVRSHGGCPGEWLRGVAVSRGQMVAGVSEVNSRTERSVSNSRIISVGEDRSCTSLAHFSGSGMIHDLRASTSDDFTHNGLELRTYGTPFARGR